VRPAPPNRGHANLAKLRLSSGGWHGARGSRFQLDCQLIRVANELLGRDPELPHITIIGVRQAIIGDRKASRLGTAFIDLSSARIADPLPAFRLAGSVRNFVCGPVDHATVGDVKRPS
jgi:hypothetical protein